LKIFQERRRELFRIRKALPNVKFKDGDLLVNMVRMIKFEKEIQFMKGKRGDLLF